MKPDAVKAVMAHEMGHYVLNHGPKHAIAFTLIPLGGLIFTKLVWNRRTRVSARAGSESFRSCGLPPCLAAIPLTYMLFATPLYQHT